jgi:hypothetical protein
MHRLVVFAPRGHSYMVGTNIEIKCHVSTPFLVVLGEILKMFSTLLYGLDGRLSSGGGHDSLFQPYRSPAVYESRGIDKRGAPPLIVAFDSVLPTCPGILAPAIVGTSCSKIELPVDLRGSLSDVHPLAGLARPSSSSSSNLSYWDTKLPSNILLTSPWMENISWSTISLKHVSLLRRNACLA